MVTSGTYTKIEGILYRNSDESEVYFDYSVNYEIDERGLVEIKEFRLNNIKYFVESNVKPLFIGNCHNLILKNFNGNIIGGLTIIDSERFRLN